MGFRYRKSVQVIPGLRLNISNRGVGYSVGGKGYRVSTSANGRVTRTVSIPGTGISNVKTVRSGRGAARSGKPSKAAPLPKPPAPPAPAIFAPRWEKDLFDALARADPQGLAVLARKHGPEHPDVRVLAAALDGLAHFLLPAETSQQRARELLAWAVIQPGNLATHPYVLKYLREHTWPVEITFGVTAHLRLRDQVELLSLAELHQAAGDLDAAIWTVEQAEPTAAAALSLAELYSDADRHQDVIDLTNGIVNEDDATALLLALRGRAFTQLGYQDAAREALREALRVKNRTPQVRHRALLERAQVSLRQNRKAAARKDVETVLAEDPAHPGLADMLADLPPPSTSP